METTERVRLLVAPLAEDLDVEIYDLEYSGGILRITVDRAGGVDIGTIGRLTRNLSRVLDEEDPVAGEYTLEVSSPGLERALRTSAHYVRSIGEQVAIKTRPGIDGDRRLTGEVVSVDTDADTVTVRPEGAAADDPAAVRVLAITDIERARTVFSWGPAPKPGGAKRPTNPSTKKKAARS